MNCRHCGEPIQRCTRGKNNRGLIHATGLCKGYAHARDGWHSCAGSEITGRCNAEAEPGQPSVTEAPAGKPQGEVA